MKNRNEIRKMIIEAENRLGDFKSLDILLEYVLTEARALMNADAGSVYEYDASSGTIRILFAQNDTLQKKLGEGEKLPYTAFSMRADPTSISGYCALSEKIVNIDNVYNLPAYLDTDQKEKCPFKFNSASDLATNYHTKSMLTIPIRLQAYSKLVVLQLINAKDEDGNIVPFDEDDEYYISDFATHIKKYIEHAHEIENMIMSMAYMAELRDPKETGLHVKRVGAFALEIYDRYAASHDIPMNEREHYRDNLKMAATCHDFGKIGVSDLILKKPGRFTDEERNVMKGHTCFGAQIFKFQNTEFSSMAMDVCLHHHDRWDGDARGYPGNYEDFMSLKPGEPIPENRGELSGDAIPLSARIVAIADVFDALVHERVYKEAWTTEDTFNEILSQRGGQFDPELTDCFMSIKERILAINSSNS